MSSASNQIPCVQCSQPFIPERPKHRFCSHQCWTARRRSLAPSRFWAKVNRDGPIPPHRPELGPCWVWTACRAKGGYGSVVIHGKSTLAHRASWALTYGSPPADMEVCHHCDNPACVRPDHLFLGTHSDNMSDMTTKCRRKNLGAPGSRHGAAKFTEAQVHSLRQRYAAGGVTQEQLAAESGVKQSTISRILSRELWTHI